MNPMTNVKNIAKLNETELASGSIHKKSWHDMYKESAWIFIGGLQYGLTEGDILAVFSQYGEIVNINLIRDKKTGKSKGFCFLCYSNQKSTVLAVDNFNGIKLCNRTIRVDHVANYKPPKEDERDDEITKTLKTQGCAPNIMQTLNEDKSQTKKKKSKKEKKKKKRKHSSDASDSDKDSHALEIKKEKYDLDYDKYDTSSKKTLKVKHGEHFLERSNSENTAQENKVQYKDRYVVDNGLLKKIKQEKESSQNKKTRNDHFKPTSSLKSRKRNSSSTSSDESFENDVIQQKHEENMHSKSKKKYKSAGYNSSSSSDDDCSTQSSSDYEKSKLKYSVKDKYRSSNEKKSHVEENRSKYYQISENPNYSLSKSRQHDKTERYSDLNCKVKHKSYDKTEKYSDLKSKVKHKNYENDMDDKNSDYHKRKYDKR